MVNQIGYRYDQVFPGYPTNIRLFFREFPAVEFPIQIDSPTERQALVEALEATAKDLEKYQQIKRLCE